MEKGDQHAAKLAQNGEKLNRSAQNPHTSAPYILNSPKSLHNSAQKWTKPPQNLHTSAQNMRNPPQSLPNTGKKMTKSPQNLHKPAQNMRNRALRYNQTRTKKIKPPHHATTRRPKHLKTRILKKRHFKNSLISEASARKECPNRDSPVSRSKTGPDCYT